MGFETIYELNISIEYMPVHTNLRAAREETITYM